jgi:CHAT domain-containing protein
MWVGYIHLACHGSAGTPPMRKARSTWPGGALDASSERLTFREVMDFRTSARLVVPSACESALGAQSEGIQGLTRAGCLPGLLVASQWRVDDDATAEVRGAPGGS